MARTGLVYREEFLRHDAGPMHPERADRLRAILRGFQEAGLKFHEIEAAPAAHEDLLRVHSEVHIRSIRETCKNHLFYPDPDTRMVPESWDAALLAAGGAIAACRAVLDGKVDNAFCAVRPPGHHAERDRAMGFCLFNNVAVAARWLRDAAKVKRVAIVDWDMHHGNGTQQAFFHDETVYYVSVHEHPQYPGTGFPNERGSKNTILNIQMEFGAGPREWLDALDSKVLPELRRFDPEFILISCGFDAHYRDPLGAQELQSETFGDMTRRVMELAGGRIVSVLEGGYDLQALAESAVAHTRALRGEEYDKH